MSESTVRAEAAEAGETIDAARRQSLFRDVNENIAELTGLLSETGYNLYICECSRVDCAEGLELSVAEYEAVRRARTRFVVAPGHQREESERVVEDNGRFLVVERDEQEFE